jgi:adenosylhomocysteine nucleosidase
MRKNIFLHFLNRDSREIYGLFQAVRPTDHYRALIRGLKIAALLCDEYCVTPPQFVLECPVARKALTELKLLRSHGIVVYPMRESSPGDMIEKKRREYAPYGQRYSEIFKDKAISILTDSGRFLPRSVEMGRGISDDWMEGPDSKREIWKNFTLGVAPKSIEEIRAIPTFLIDRGAAATWAGIQPCLPLIAPDKERQLRRILQNTYFRLYMQAYDLRIISELPFMVDEFGLAANDPAYSYYYFSSILSCLSLRDLIIRASPSTILLLRENYGFIEFIDSYTDLCGKVTKRSGNGRSRLRDLQYMFSLSARNSRFNWERFEQYACPEEIGDITLNYSDVRELGDGLKSVTNELKLMTDIDRLPSKDAQRKVKGAEANKVGKQKIAIFVALESEFDILIKRWKLNRGGLTGVQASGVIRDVPLEVFCTFGMGRVTAAIEAMKYLQACGDEKPIMIIVAGLAGAISEEAEVGHIIVAETVVDLATRKIRDGEVGIHTEFRRRDFVTADVISKILRSRHFNLEEWERHAIEEADWPKGKRPAIHYGLVTSLDEVISSKDWKEELLRATPKLLGVEMEAGGVCAAAQLFGIPVAVLRTVSDKADPSKKDDQWRRIAMVTLATLIESLDLKVAIDYLRGTKV